MPVLTQLADFLARLDAMLEAHSKRLALLEQHAARQERVINHLLERLALQPPGTPENPPESDTRSPFVVTHLSAEEMASDVVHVLPGASSPSAAPVPEKEP